MKREEGIVAGMTVGSLCRSKSANKSRDMVVEEGIKSHRRTRLAMAQKKLELDLWEVSERKRAVPGFEGGSWPRGIEMDDVQR